MASMAYGVETGLSAAAGGGAMSAAPGMNIAGSGTASVVSGLGMMSICGGGGGSGMMMGGYPMRHYNLNGANAPNAAPLGHIYPQQHGPSGTYYC